METRYVIARKIQWEGEKRDFYMKGLLPYVDEDGDIDVIMPGSMLIDDVPQILWYRTREHAEQVLNYIAGVMSIDDIEITEILIVPDKQ